MYENNNRGGFVHRKRKGLGVFFLARRTYSRALRSIALARCQMVEKREEEKKSKQTNNQQQKQRKRKNVCGQAT